MSYRDWGLGIWDWGLGGEIGEWGLGTGEWGLGSNLLPMFPVAQGGDSGLDSG
jgi:hypothetical protein